MQLPIHAWVWSLTMLVNVATGDKPLHKTMMANLPTYICRPMKKRSQHFAIWSPGLKDAMYTLRKLQA